MAHSGYEKRVEINLPRSISLLMCSEYLRRAVRPIMMSREYLWRQKSRFAVAARLGSSWTSLSSTRLDAMLENCAWMWCHWKSLTAPFITEMTADVLEFSRAPVNGQEEAEVLITSGKRIDIFLLIAFPIAEYLHVYYIIAYIISLYRKCAAVTRYRPLNSSSLFIDIFILQIYSETYSSVRYFPQTEKTRNKYINKMLWQKINN